MSDPISTPFTAPIEDAEKAVKKLKTLANEPSRAKPDNENGEKGGTTANNDEGAGSPTPPVIPSTFLPLDSDLINEMKEKVKFYQDWAQICIWLYWILGISSVILATLAASDVITAIARPRCALFAAICTAAIGYINPQRRASKFLTAYRMLEPALREYIYNKSGEPLLQKLLDTHVKAEAILNDGEFDGR